MPSKNKAQLLKLLAKNKWDELIDAIEEVVINDRLDLSDEWINLQANYHQLQSDIINGILSSEQLEVSRNRLRNKFLIFINLLDTSKKGNSIKFRFIVLALIFFSPIMLSFLKPLNISFKLNVESEFVRLSADEVIDINAILDSFIASEVDKITIDTFQPFVFNEKKTLVEFYKFGSGKLKLNSISGLQEKANFFISVDNGEITFELDNVDSIFCNLNFSSIRFKIQDYYDTLIIAPPDHVLPTDLLLTNPYFLFGESLDSSFFLQNVSINDVSFTEKGYGINRKPISGIKSGNISIINKTGALKTYALDRENFVHIDKPVSLTIAKTYRKGDHLKIELVGKAKDIKVGIDSKEKQSLKPSVIEVV